MAKEGHKKASTHSGSSHGPHASHAHPHKKVFDVVRPGKAPASATSRPVLVSQKPPVADDQFVPTAPPLRASDPSRKHDLLDSKKRKALTPVGIDTGGSFGTVGGGVDRALVSAAATAPELPQQTSSSESKKTRVDEAPSAPDSTDSAVGATTQKTRVVPSENAKPSTEDATSSPSAAATVPAPIWELDEEPTPAHLAMEQVVDADDGIQSHHLHGGGHDGETAPRASELLAGGSGALQSSNADSASAVGNYGSNSTPSRPKTIDELLAETGAPSLDNEPPSKLIVSHHRKHSPSRSVAGPIIVILVLLFLAAVIFNVLLDSGLIDTPYNIPRTDFL